MTGHTQVAGIDDAYRLLSPITGTAAAALFFGIALLASGQSSTFTGTLAGQIVLEGFLQLKIPLWQRRMITRLIAIVPAMAGAILLGDHAVGGMLVASQMVLPCSFLSQSGRWFAPVAIRRSWGLATSRLHAACAWLILAVISLANLWLVYDVVTYGML
jgi:manganese transport protein